MTAETISYVEFHQAWETEEEDDEVTQEAMWRADELANGIGINEIEKAQREVETQQEASSKRVEQLARESMNSAYSKLI
ncbi:hypothetical protein VE03_10269 [Pseudogymnoascus sp. 23342-1-I1]|nr:hypothetical protein VE03_10269 [Pseudogymnoascus sp. 23342-1-I1]